MTESDAGSGPGDYHADEFFRYEYSHGTRYLGKMGRMAFAHFDIDDDGTIFPLMMDESEFDRDKWEKVSPDHLPTRAVELIEEKFENRKSISEHLP